MVALISATTWLVHMNVLVEKVTIRPQMERLVSTRTNVKPSMEVVCTLAQTQWDRSLALAILVTCSIPMDQHAMM